MKVRKILYIIIIAALLVIFGVSAFYVADYFIDSYQQKKEYDELASIVESVRQELTDPTATVDPLDPDAPSQATDPVEGKPILPEYRVPYDLNNDLVGWLKIEGTRINYPVMQSPDAPDYYLYRNFQKEYNVRGCLYARESCNVAAPSDNVTIYGHNMNDGSMFHDLNQFQFKDYYEDHSIINFDTLTERHTYKIFAVFKTTASLGEGFPYHRFENAATEEEFNNFIAECKRLSFFDTGITPVYGDKIICLSTCEYTQTNGRLVVAAYRTGE